MLLLVCIMVLVLYWQYAAEAGHSVAAVQTTRHWLGWPTQNTDPILLLAEALFVMVVFISVYKKQVATH